MEPIKPAEPVITVKRNIRQVRSKLSTPIDVDVSLELPEDVCFKLYNFNLSGAGIAIPVQYDTELSKEVNVEKNSIIINVKEGQNIRLHIPEERPFKRELDLSCKIVFVSKAKKIQDVTFLYYLGLSFNSLMNRDFSTIESALLRL